MFWQNNYAPSVQIEFLLNHEDVTLTELMDAEDILQECKNQNKKLLEFLTRADILEELVNLITEEPSDELEERWRYKYSNVACELLTCDVPVLTEKIAGNEILLTKLYSFIEKDQPLNPLLASFFSKTLHALLRRNSDQDWFSYQFVCLQVLEFLKSRKNCVDLLLQHIETSAIMDLILILLTKIEGDEMRHNILNWLDDQKLIQKLILLLSPLENSEKHTNVCQLLCDIIISPHMEPEKRPEPILQTLQSEESIKAILETILTEGKTESSIVAGLRILMNLIGQKESKATDATDTYGATFQFVENEYRIKIAKIILPYLPKFNQLLLDPPKKQAIQTTAGCLEKPFGKTRLFILKLYVRLLSTESPEVFSQFIELDTYQLLLDLFFEFEWNNFLHTEVQHCISSTVNYNSSETTETVFENIFIKSKLLDRILDVLDTDNAVVQQNRVRQGYKGHLIVIANEIVTGYKENEILMNYLKTNIPENLMQKWENFVSTTLSEINKKQQLSLGDPPENYLSSSGTDEYSSFPEDTYGQDIYGNYTESSYTDNDFNFQMENYNDEENTFQSTLEQLNDAFPDNYEKSQELFDKICSEKKFDDINKDDQWELDPNFPKKYAEWYKNDNVKNFNSSSSDDDEEDEDADNNQDFCIKTEESDPWNSLGQSAIENSSTDIWKTSSDQTGWANFDNFNTDTTFEMESKQCTDTTFEMESKQCTDTTFEMESKQCNNTTFEMESKQCTDTAFEMESKQCTDTSTSNLSSTNNEITPEDKEISNPQNQSLNYDDNSRLDKDEQKIEKTDDCSGTSEILCTKTSVNIPDDNSNSLTKEEKSESNQGG